MGFTLTYSAPVKDTSSSWPRFHTVNVPLRDRQMYNFCIYICMLIIMFIHIYIFKGRRGRDIEEREGR